MDEFVKRSGRFALAQAVVSFVGSIVAGTIWWAHRSHIDLPCTSNGGCDLVMNSRYSVIHLVSITVPLAMAGFAAYLTLLVLSLCKWASETLRGVTVLKWAIFAGAAGGFLFSWYLQWVAHYKIGAFCIWCRTSACIMTLLFIISAFECFGRPRTMTSPKAKEIPHASTTNQ